MTIKDSCKVHSRNDAGTWMEVDGRGIPLCRVCEDCVEQKLAGYRPEILRRYTQADVDEQIEEDL